MTSTSADAPATAHGQCLCGTITYTVQLPSLWCAHCHCSLCRRAHGAGFVTWLGCRRSGFAVTHGGDRLQWYDSSADSRRAFCPRCGTTLLFESHRWPGEIHITLASFSTPVDRQPEVNAYSADRVEWAPLDPDLPAK